MKNDQLFPFERSCRACGCPATATEQVFCVSKEGLGDWNQIYLLRFCRAVKLFCHFVWGLPPSYEQ